MKKKIISLVVTAFLCLTSLVPAFAEELGANTVAGKLEQAETFMYGAVQTGSLVSRVDKLETDTVGQKTSGSVMSRVDRMYNRLEGAPNNGQLSVAALMNVIEWQFADRMSSDAATTRVGSLENQIFGTEYTHDSMVSRVNRLTKAAFPSGSLTPSNVILPKDSLIKIKFMEDISSKENQAGDSVDYVVDDNVYVGETLILPKGAKGVGKIKKIVQPRIFGRDARIDLDFNHVLTVSGEAVPVTMGELAKQQAKTAAGAAGASIGGMVLLGPVGIVGGAFVKGSSVTIPAGSGTYVQVTEDTSVNGIMLAGTTASGQQLDENAAAANEVVVAKPAVIPSKGTVEDKTENGTAPVPGEKDMEPAGPALDEADLDDKAAAAIAKEAEKADEETEAALAEDEKKEAAKADAAAKEAAAKAAAKAKSKKEEAPMLDEDDGSAYEVPASL